MTYEISSSLEYELKKKVYRFVENKKKLEFIIKNTDIIEPVLIVATRNARPNKFHNFGHQIGAAESFVKLGIEARISKKELTEGTVGLLFHDALHTGIQRSYDEMRSYEALVGSLDETDYQTMNLGSPAECEPKFRKIILSTIFSERKKREDEILNMVQDADLGHLGQGHVYWLWASMGLVDEFADEGRKVSPISFIRQEQRKFIDFLCSISGNGVYLSEAAKKVFQDPRQSLIELESLKPSQIDFAYKHRTADISISDFAKQLRNH